MVVLGSFDDGGGIASLGRAQESLCVAGAGGGAQGELDAARGFGLVVTVDISGFQLSGQVAWGRTPLGVAGSGESLSWEGRGGHRWRWAEGLSLVRSILYLPLPCVLGGASSGGAGPPLEGRGGAGLCGSR